MKQTRIILFIFLTTLLACSQSRHKDLIAEERVAGNSYEEESSALYVSNQKQSATRSLDLPANASKADVEDMGGASPEPNHISSMAVLPTDTSFFKLITRTEIKFKVADINQDMAAIEKTVLLENGFIMESSYSASESYRVFIGQTNDSLFYKMKFTKNGNITAYVPKNNLYNFLEKIAPLSLHTDYRKITSQDVAIDLLKSKMEKERALKKQARLKNTIAGNKGKLNDAISAEQALDYAAAEEDQAKLEMFNMDKNLRYSRVTISLYQDPSEKTYSTLREKEYKIPISSQVFNAFGEGWEILQNIIVFFVNIWPLFIVVGLVIFFLIRRKKKKNVR